MVSLGYLKDGQRVSTVCTKPLTANSKNRLRPFWLKPVLVAMNSAMKSAMELLHVEKHFQKHALVVSGLMLLCAAAYAVYQAAEIMHSMHSPPVLVSMKSWNGIGEWAFCNVPQFQDHAQDAGLGFFQSYSGNVKIHLRALPEALEAGKSASSAELRVSRRSLPVQIHDSKLCQLLYRGYAELRGV